MPLRVLGADGRGTVADAIEAYERAGRDGVRVVNLPFWSDIVFGALIAALAFARATMATGAPAISYVNVVLGTWVLRRSLLALRRPARGVERPDRRRRGRDPRGAERYHEQGAGDGRTRVVPALKPAAGEVPGRQRSAVRARCCTNEAPSLRHSE
jgi:hypothetical protein